MQASDLNSGISTASVLKNCFELSLEGELNESFSFITSLCLVAQVPLFCCRKNKCGPFWRHEQFTPDCSFRAEKWIWHLSATN